MCATVCMWTYVYINIYTCMQMSNCVCVGVCRIKEITRIQR